MRSADHITDALVSLHWLHVPEQIEYKIAVLTYKVLQGSVPRYLGPLARVADQPGRRTLHSASSSSLLVPPVRFSTVGSRVFSVAGPRVCMQHPAGRDDISTITDDFLSTSEKRGFSDKLILISLSDLTSLLNYSLTVSSSATKAL